MSKLEEIWEYTNPNIVFERAKRLYGRNVKIRYSEKKNKKYDLYDPNTDKWISFGQVGYKDFTKTGDEEKRRRFMIRNHRWASSPKYSASYNSYYLLW